jgi:hypothetical protein
MSINCARILLGNRAMVRSRTTASPVTTSATASSSSPNEASGGRPA